MKIIEGRLKKRKKKEGTNIGHIYTVKDHLFNLGTLGENGGTHVNYDFAG